MKKTSALVLKLSELGDIELEFLDKNVISLAKAVQGGVSIPGGFVVTSHAFIQFLTDCNLQKKINDLVSTIHFERSDSLMQVSGHIKKLILDSKIPDDLVKQIEDPYEDLSGIFTDAEVSIGDNNNKTKGEEKLILKIKQLWAADFDPKHLLMNQKHLSGIFQTKKAIVVQKIINSKYSGKLFTSDLAIKTNSKLNQKQTAELQLIAKKLRTHFFLPQVAYWIIDKNKIFVTSIKPATSTQKSYLVLVRHGQSVWNAKDLWTGWTDVELSEKGRKQAEDAGHKLKDIHFDIAFTSALVRAKQTLEEIEIGKGQLKIPIVSDKALNERNYGDMTGKNKWEIKKEFGDKQFLKWRRGFDEPIPNGETLKEVYHRVVPYYNNEILPKLKSGKNVIIAAHGNSLRALVKYLENVSDEDIEILEIPVGQILVYQIDEDGKVVNKEIRN